MQQEEQIVRDVDVYPNFVRMVPASASALSQILEVILPRSPEQVGRVIAKYQAESINPISADMFECFALGRVWRIGVLWRNRDALVPNDDACRPVDG